MILTLCGSSRFEEYFKAYNLALTLAGHTVLTMCSYPSDMNFGCGFTKDEKEVLDSVHKNKIRISEGIILINVAGYIGDSTLSEIRLAERLRLPIYPLEALVKGQNQKHSNPRNTLLYDRYNIPSNYRSPIDTYVNKARCFYDINSIKLLSSSDLKSKSCEILSNLM